jgi:GT2 family glycosyltransferase
MKKPLVEEIGRQPCSFKKGWVRTPGSQGWYGQRHLSDSELFSGLRVRDDIFDADETTAEQYATQTESIVHRYLRSMPREAAVENWFCRFGAPDLVNGKLSPRNLDGDVCSSYTALSYTVVTTFFRHLGFFQQCAKRVARLIAHDGRDEARQRVEWIVMNDDPEVSAANLRAVMPEELGKKVRIVSDGQNRGIAERLNEGCRLASHEWLLFLDCDDLIAIDACDVLDHYIAAFPHCRYVSSTMIDVDKNGSVLRRRRRRCPPSDLLNQGMIAGHLMAVRRDLLADIGGFDPRFSGTQDYDFALRTAARESILLIPDSLYAYRWHGASQSVSRIRRQAVLAASVRKAFLRGNIEEPWPSKAVVAPGPAIRPAVSRGACFIRTQGRRLELLEESIFSVACQVPAILPIVIAHGSDDNYEGVREWISARPTDVAILHAPDTTRRRGHPLNVGLCYLEENWDRFDYVSLLDDDDIYYPFFSERMVDALNLTNADAIYCLTNSRAPGGALQTPYWPLPTSCLATANFMPTNSLVMRTDVLKATGPRFREDMDYLEDWDFLLQLLAAGAQFHHLPEALAEFRLIGDGNAEIKKDPQHYKQCSAMVQVRAAVAAKILGPGAFYRGLLDFDFAGRPPLDLPAIGQISATATLFRNSRSVGVGR